MLGFRLYYGGYPVSNAPAFIDNSGMSWALCSSPGGPCGGSEFFVDTNGLKGPNKYGQDRFAFYPLTSNNTVTGGALVKLGVAGGDCLDSVSCPNYTNSCPSVAQHPCYFQSWILNE